MTTRRLLLVGATGVFGRRLAANLAGISGLELPSDVAPARQRRCVGCVACR